jgi:hypothetical protein
MISKLLKSISNSTFCFFATLLILFVFIEISNALLNTCIICDKTGNIIAIVFFLIISFLTFKKGVFEIDNPLVRYIVNLFIAIAIFVLFLILDFFLAFFGFTFTGELW